MMKAGFWKWPYGFCTPQQPCNMLSNGEVIVDILCLHDRSGIVNKRDLSCQALLQMKTSEQNWAEHRMGCHSGESLHYASKIRHNSGSYNWKHKAETQNHDDIHRHTFWNQQPQFCRCFPPPSQRRRGPRWGSSHLEHWAHVVGPSLMVGFEKTGAIGFYDD